MNDTNTRAIFIGGPMHTEERVLQGNPARVEFPVLKQLPAMIPHGPFGPTDVFETVPVEKVAYVRTIKTRGRTIYVHEDELQ